MSEVHMDKAEMVRRAALVGDFRDQRPRRGYATAAEALEAAGATPPGFQDIPFNDGLAYFGRPDLTFDAWRVMRIPAGVPMGSNA